jgi:hypothetical protein
MNQVLKRLILACSVVLALAALAPALFAQDDDAEAILSVRDRLEKVSKVADPANGAAVFVAGDLWQSYLPSGVGHYYNENVNDPKRIWDLIRVGNFDRGWRHPTAMYPGEYPKSWNWSGDIKMVEYNPDPNFNPSAPAGESNYALGFYRKPVPGAIAARSKEVYFEDANKRHVALYEAEFPTNLGINVKITGRQYTLNWNNFNDFVVLEIQLTNTGVLDVDGDGVAEKTGNKINALALGMHTEVMYSAAVGSAGGRSANHFGSGRNGGYDGTPDATGAPWATAVEFAGANPANFVQGQIRKDYNDLGIGAYPDKNYTDIWMGYTWIAAKQGDGKFGNADKQTIFGTHGIGVGAERGRYLSVGNGQGGIIGATANPKTTHTAFMGTWYKNGGKTFKNSDFDFNPNPNFFQSGTAGNPTTFVPKAAGRTLPDGDAKLNGTFAQKFEDDWKVGFNAQHNFDGDLFCGIGPFSLEVGETMTLVFAEFGGYRLEGVRGALNAARWAHQNNWKIPEPPPTPDLKVEPAEPQPGTFKSTVKWDNRAESAADFAGYKIYRSATAPKFSSIDGGMRLLDRYQEQTQPGQDLAPLADAVNPYFDRNGFLLPMRGGGWGPYKLVKNITKAELSQYLNTGTDAAQYKYKFVDDSREVVLGVTYWYYVAAYDNESGSAAGKNYTTLETSNVNRNGRSGLWEGTYPFATGNSFFPAATNTAKLKDLGVSFVVVGPVNQIANIQSGLKPVKVSPNPYRAEAFHDTGQEHKVLFLNLPDKAKISIFDVAGQLIDVIDFTAPSAANGTVFWDMFSKDGIEVASGLYLYVVEYSGGKQTGYFSIMR